MKRREALLAVAGALLLTISAGWLVSPAFWRREETLITLSCELRATILGSDRAPTHAVLFHGLAANRRTLLPLGNTLADMDMQVFIFDHPGHGDSTQPFDYDRAEQCAIAAVEWLEKDGRIQLDNTVLIGHSMGAGVAIRLADYSPTAATISISTAMRKPVASNPPGLEPLPFPRRLPVNLLLLNGEYDLPQLKEITRELLRAAGGERTAHADFAQRRAVQWEVIPHATHTSLLVDNNVQVAIGDWVEKVLPGRKLSPAHLPALTMIQIGLGLFGLVLLFPGAATLLCSSANSAESSAPHGATRSLSAWALAALLAVLAQYRFVTLGPLVHMYSGDYLASVLMICGVLLLMFHGSWTGQSAPLPWGVQRGAILGAAVLAVATMLAFGAWLNWQITDAWLNAPRWWRFAVLVPLLLPYHLAENVALGAPSDTKHPARYLGRFLHFVALRTLLWLGLLFGMLVLDSAQMLMGLLAIYFLAFSILQHLGMTAVRRRTGSATVAAVFGAILGAWFIAAVFPIT